MRRGTNVYIAGRSRIVPATSSAPDPSLDERAPQIDGGAPRRVD
jgi:hypothetical protein